MEKLLPLYFSPHLSCLYHHGSILLSFFKISTLEYSERIVKTTDFLQANSRWLVAGMFNTALETVEWISSHHKEEAKTRADN